MRLPARGFSVLGFIVIVAGMAHAQDAAQTTPNPWLLDDSLKPVEDQQRQTASGETFKATAGQDITNPFTVLPTDALWQEKYGTIYTRRVADSLSLSCETTTVGAGDDFQPLSCGQKVGFQLQPGNGLTLRADVHDSTVQSLTSPTSTSTTGASLSAEGSLPTNSTLTLGVRSDRTGDDVPSGLITETNACDAQIKQPLGKLPVSAVFKGHYEGSSDGGAPATSLPSLEQSLVWKPAQDTTVQAGLRQQQYQEYPGVDHQLNEALFADWSQKVVDNVSWHSYAEVLNSKGLLDQAPGSPIASGANGTPQATTPGSNASPTSSLPISIDEQTLTFSTGPSVQLQKDISASVEYSDRWDKNPAAGNAGQEQRVSVSVKGSF